MPLEEYRSKRDFSRTPEPAGASAPEADGLAFVVQKHAARALHYDFRLEHEGVLLSWAIPKGPSLDPADKRLAVQVEDHPLDYGGFEGAIPEGEYGGGTVMVWDRGTWEPVGDAAAMLAKGDLKLRLHGTKLTGEWALVRMKRREKEKRDNWLLIKHRDEAVRTHDEHDVLDEDRSALSGRTMEQIAADPDALWHSEGDDAGRAIPTAGSAPASAAAPAADQPPPGDTPGFALATAAERAPEGDGWLHEVKLDGYRAMLVLREGHARFYARNGGDWTERFAALATAAEALPTADAIVDGEVCALMPDGTTSFGALQEALTSGGPLTYFAFDLLRLDGQDLRGQPLAERKSALAALLAKAPKGAPMRYVDHVDGRGAAFHTGACEFELEGSVSKRADSRYRSGRTRDWVKVKCLKRQEFVIVGWTDPKGSRTGLGALLLGVYDDGELRSAGRVGTGFSETTLSGIRARLDGLAADESPLAGPPSRAAGAHWVRPELVAEVAFTEWTRDGALRHPVFVGLREDKPPAQVVRERSGSADPASQDPDPARATASPRLTNPGRVLWPADGITKRELAEYWTAVAERALPHVGGRLLTLVRCPEGHDAECFYQKHVEGAFPDAVRRLSVKTRGGAKDFAYVEDAEGLLGLVQMGVLEIHPWGSRTADIDSPDRITFDLDPGPGVDWERIVAAAVTVRDTLAGVGLTAFVKTTGGAGLHVVTPVVAEHGWDEVRAFARSVAEAMAGARPDDFTAKMAKALRKGRILVDYVRNAREATAVAAYSPRAREGAPVSTPVTWDQLAGGLDPASLTLRSVPDRLGDPDPWDGFEKARARLPFTSPPD